jgi:anti-sigma factor RsiW
MKCEELLAALNEFVDGELDLAGCEAFEEHLAGCNPCQIVVDNIRRTIALYKSGRPYEMPEAFHRHLRSTLRDRWKAKYPSADA